MELVTERLRLREMTDDDLDAMAALLGDADVMRHYPRPKTRHEARGWIEWNKRNYAEHGFGLWILETAAGEFVGDCGLTVQRVDGVDDVEVGYHVRTDLQGRGYATEAAAACRDHAAAIGVRRLIAVIAPENRASQRVAEKIGLTFERQARSHDRDIVLYATALPVR